MPGPDFPTGALIMGRAGIYEAYRTGRGAVVMRARHKVEEGRNGRHILAFTEVPYQVNKERVLEKIGELARSKQIEGIAGANDESDREGVRLVVEVKRDADPEVVLNQLFRFTQLQTSFGVNMLALIGGRPEQMGLLEVLKAFLAFREGNHRPAHRLSAGGGPRQGSHACRSGPSRSPISTMSWR